VGGIREKSGRTRVMRGGLRKERKGEEEDSECIQKRERCKGVDRERILKSQSGCRGAGRCSSMLQYCLHSTRYDYIYLWSVYIVGPELSCYLSYPYFMYFLPHLPSGVSLMHLVHMRETFLTSDHLPDLEIQISDVSVPRQSERYEEEAERQKKKEILRFLNHQHWRVTEIPDGNAMRRLKRL